MLGLGPRLGVDLLELRRVKHRFAQQLALKDLYRILRPAVFLNLGLGPVGVVRVGHRMSPVAVGADFDHGRLALHPRLLECFAMKARTS